MRRNKKSCSISEFCRNNNFRTLEFYKMLSRHPEPARKMKANSKAFSCSAGRDKCGFFIYKRDKRIGRNYKADEISELLSKGKVTLKNCTSSKGNKYSAVFSLEDTGKYVNLKMEEFVGGKKRRGA